VIKKFLNPVTTAKEFMEQKRSGRAVLFILIHAALIGLIHVFSIIRCEAVVGLRYRQTTQGFLGYVALCFLPFALTSAAIGFVFPLIIKLTAKIRRVEIGFVKLLSVSGICNFLMIPWTLVAHIPLFFIALDTYDYSIDYSAYNKFLFTVTGLLLLFGLIYGLFSSVIALKETAELNGDAAVKITAFGVILTIILYLVVDSFTGYGLFGEFIYYRFAYGIGLAVD